jgi:hypothetical protein
MMENRPTPITKLTKELCLMPFGSTLALFFGKYDQLFDRYTFTLSFYEKEAQRLGKYEDAVMVQSQNVLWSTRLWPEDRRWYNN